jgi:transposase
MNLKKKLIEKANKEPEKLIYFFDESRFGTHSKIGHGWFMRGVRTEVKMKLGFQNFYLYSAVNPRSGEDFTLIAPNVNTICMNIFLEKLSEYIGDTQIILVMDCAGWHRARNLNVPKNITIMYLPPYSPELNPVERFWRFIKQHTIKNKIYENIDLLEQAVSTFIKQLDKLTISSLCCVDYLYS